MRNRSSRTTSAPPEGLSGSGFSATAAGLGPDFGSGLAGSAFAGSTFAASVLAGSNFPGMAGPIAAGGSGSAMAGLRRGFPGFGASSAGFSVAAGSLARALGHGLELQAELHRRIEEAFDRLERDVQLLGNAVERERDLEMRLGDGEIPELVLQHDGHLFRILLAQARRELHAGRARIERDVEMMLARQAAGLGHVGEHAAHHRAQRLLGQQIVADVIDRHPANLKTRGEM